MLESNLLSSGHPNTFLGQTGIGYKICDRLGAGSASVVFRCHTVGRLTDNGIMIPMEEEYYAVKIIDVKSIYLTPDYNEKKRRLLEEAMILQKLRHPNIVSLVDFSDSGDSFYLVMDLVQGGELFYKIVECGSLTESSARYILKQVVEALIYMHQKEIIHRDLKPENILIDKISPGNYFNIKVADFGVAKFLRHGYTQARTLVGTPQYWAPEVLIASKMGDSYGPEADLWSLGVLFYVMLGGAFPFDERKGNLEQLIKTGNYHFRYPRFKRVSDEAKYLIKRLLTVNPKERMTLMELKEDPWMKITCRDEPNIEYVDQKPHINYNKQEIVLFKPLEEDKTLVKTPNSSSVTNFNVSRISKSSKTSSIMDINGLLDLQLSVAYKLHGIYIAFRHNSSICKLLQQHIHKWRILQQQSCLAIGKFKQTCESVLDELPDFLLAVNTNEPKLAIELLSHVKQLVDVTQNDVELIQNGYNDFLFELSNFVESIQNIKRITETSNNMINLSSNNGFKNEDACFKEETNNDTSPNSLGSSNQNSFDPSIFIGYNSARDKVIRRITDLFSDAEINNLLNPPLDSQNSKEILPKLDFDEKTDEEKIRDQEKFNKEDLLNRNCDSNLQIEQVSLNETSQVEKKESSYITTSLTSTRDLLLDFLFLPASICNVPPSGIESVLQESIDFGLPNLNSFEGTDSLDEERIERNSSMNSINSNNHLVKSNESIAAGISNGIKNKFNGAYSNSDKFSNFSNSNSLLQQDQIKRNENQLKISYILVRVLAQLRMIESILGRCVAFWGNMNIMIERILQLRQHAERLLGFTENPVLRTRFDERVESYREFWKDLRDICDSYLQSAQSRQLSLENQVHELLDTASKVDTVMNMNMI